MGLKDTARQILGELFITGFNGLELSEDTSHFISQAQIGGVILFSHNFENPGQLAELTNQVQECRTQLPLWVSTDHEGGKAQKLKKGFTRIPDAASIGDLNSPKLAFEISEVMAKELKAVGINLNFAPVADIATNKNSAIGSRAYGYREEVVSKMATAIARGHLVNNVQPCLKHFPGHGDTSTDSHHALPKVDTSLETLEDRELKPFLKTVKSKCSMVMTGHIVYTKIDPNFPATLSPLILRDLLRKSHRYNRVIVSDDMELKAITENFSAEDAPRLALEAGCDILVYRTEAGARHAYEALTKALDKGKLDPEIVIAAEQRIKALKREFISNYHPVAIADLTKKLGIPAHQAIVQKIEDKS